MSERLNKILQEITENTSELKEEENDNLKDLIEEVLKIFNKKKNAYFSKIIEIISAFVMNFKIPAILILNESDLLDSLREFLNNTEKGKSLSKTEQNHLNSIWNIFSNIFSRVLSDFEDVPKIKKFVAFEIFMKSNFPNLLKKEKIPLSKYDQLFLDYLEKNLKAEKIIKKNKNKYSNGNDEKSLLEALNALNSFEQNELFSEEFSKVERFYLVLEAQNTDSLKKTILKIDQNLENQIYSKQKNNLHEREYYLLGEPFENKNNIDTHFLESPHIFYEEKFLYPMQKLFCGFLNAKGGRIYLGISNNKVQGCQLNKNYQDSLRRQIDETVRGFVPPVQAEECRTYFYPIFKKNNEFSELFVVKITINPDPSEVYFTPKPQSEVHARKDTGIEEKYEPHIWQQIFIERTEKYKNKKKNFLYVDPIPFDVNDFKKGYRIPSLKSPPYIPYNDFESNALFSKPSSEKKNKDEQNINPKFIEKDIKKIIDFKDVNKKSPDLCYDALYFRFDKKTDEDSFMDLTRKIYEFIKSHICETKILLRRKEKNYFFIELEMEVNEQQINIIKEVWMAKNSQLLEIGYANKKHLKKNQEYILIK